MPIFRAWVAASDGVRLFGGDAPFFFFLRSNVLVAAHFLRLGGFLWRI